MLEPEILLELSRGVDPYRPGPRHVPPVRLQRADRPGGDHDIHIETRTRRMRVQAFHTFPDDYAIVQSQLTFQVP